MNRLQTLYADYTDKLFNLSEPADFERVKYITEEESKMKRVFGIAMGVIGVAAVAISVLPFSVALLAPHLAGLAITQTITFLCIGIFLIIASHDVIIEGNNQRQLVKDVVNDDRFTKKATLSEVYREMNKGSLEGTWVTKRLHTMMGFA